eukprot:9729622-Alexandrium_andersonii.AAC.1
MGRQGQGSARLSLCLPGHPPKLRPGAGPPGPARSALSRRPADPKSAGAGTASTRVPGQHRQEPQAPKGSPSSRQ